MNGAEAKPLSPGQLEIDHPLILRHERRILALKRSQAELNVESIVEIGGLLREVKASLKFGFWGRWLRNHVCFGHSSADRFMKVAEYASSNSESLTKMKSLGPNKLYTLSQLSPPARARMLSRDVHSVGHDGVQKTLEQMSLIEFNALARALDGFRRLNAPHLRHLLRRGTASAERLCSVLHEFGGRRLPEGGRTERFGQLLHQLQGLIENCPYKTVPAQR